MKRFASDRVTGLMERLGLDDDVAHRVAPRVARRSSRAQSRVEGFNFDIRKRVVEFDDVINKQRETIYAERDKVLHNEDLTETVQSVPRRGDRRARRDAPRRRGPGRVEPRGPVAALGGDGPDRRGHDAPTSCGSSARREAIADHLRELADERLDGQGGRGRRGGLGDRRAARPAPDHRLAVGRAPDRARRHAPRHRPARLRPAGPAQRVQARGVPALRRAARPHPPRRRVVRSSGSRSPASRAGAEGGDPAVAASLGRRGGRAARRRNGANGRRSGASSGRGGRAAVGAGRAASGPGGAAVGGSAILRGGPAAPGDRAADARIARRRSRSAGGGPARSSASGPKPGFTPSGARIGRNDPCWCGSGAKYKKCHGR